MERSPTNLFMWYRVKGSTQGPEGYHTPPTDEVDMTCGEYVGHALEKDGHTFGDQDVIIRSNALQERMSRKTNKGANYKDNDLLGDAEEERGETR